MKQPFSRLALAILLTTTSLSATALRLTPEETERLEFSIDYDKNWGRTLHARFPERADYDQYIGHLKTILKSSHKKELPNLNWDDLKDALIQGRRLMSQCIQDILTNDPNVLQRTAHYRYFVAMANLLVRTEFDAAYAEDPIIKRPILDHLDRSSRVMIARLDGFDADRTLMRDLKIALVHARMHHLAFFLEPHVTEEARTNFLKEQWMILEELREDTHTLLVGQLKACLIVDHGFVPAVYRDKSRSTLLDYAARLMQHTERSPRKEKLGGAVAAEATGAAQTHIKPFTAGSSLMRKKEEALQKTLRQAQAAEQARLDDELKQVAIEARAFLAAEEARRRAEADALHQKERRAAEASKRPHDDEDEGEPATKKQRTAEGAVATATVKGYIDDDSGPAVMDLGDEDSFGLESDEGESDSQGKPYKLWTAEDNQHLRETYDRLDPTLSIKEKTQRIQEEYFPDRSLSSLTNNIYRLGLQRKNFKWTQEFISFIKTQRDQGQSWGTIYARCVDEWGYSKNNRALQIYYSARKNAKK